MESKYTDLTNVVNRLHAWFDTHEQLIVAFDFDDTVYDYHLLGNTCFRVHNVLKECKERGYPLILFTCRDVGTSQMEFAKDFCKSNGFEPDYINKSPANPYSVKPLYNILLDDRAGLSSSLQALEIFLTQTRK